MLVKTLNTRGDEEFLLEFSQDYPKEFFKALMALAPGVGAVQPQQGAVHLHVHASLGPSLLGFPWSVGRLGRMILMWPLQSFRTTLRQSLN
jgi:hypothetical protein